MKLAKLSMLGAAAVVMLGLSACDVPQSAPATTVQQQPPNYDDYMYNGEGDHLNADRYLFNAKKKLTDGRTAECVVFSAGNAGGVTCDFANAK